MLGYYFNKYWMLRDRNLPLDMKRKPTACVSKLFLLGRLIQGVLPQVTITVCDGLVPPAAHPNVNSLHFTALADLEGLRQKLQQYLYSPACFSPSHNVTLTAVCESWYSLLALPLKCSIIQFNQHHLLVSHRRTPAPYRTVRKTTAL